MGIGSYKYKKNFLLLSAASLALMYGAAGDAYASPEGGSVSAGSASISTNGSTTNIVQSTDKAVIDWSSFNIGSDESTQFYQPSSDSVTLNRIHDAKASEINGHLSANGHIMLINQNGVVFGAGAVVDVGSLTATTSDISNDDFMAGNYNFNKAGSPDGKIINNGRITAAEAGLVNLVAPQVENNGVIVAKLGKVQLAAADTFTIDLAGDGLIQIGVTDEDAKKIARNTGTISAEGGYVAITAGAARETLDSLVENSGLVDVSSMTKTGGKIYLGSHGGVTKNSGALKANGAKGGGEILVGGAYQGSGDTPTSSYTIVSAASVIQANSTEVGDGGTVILWANRNTGFDGVIEAIGGPDRGNGGFVEVSGKEYLDFRGDVNLNGDTLGTLLLDPDDIEIVAGTTNPAEFSDDSILFAENSGSTTTLGATTLSNSLSANANVVLQANNSITVNADVVSTGSGNLTLQTAAAGTITINNAINVNAGNLTLIADEIDIAANLSGTGDTQLKTADVTKSIEIGNTTSSSLNLTATELAYLQNGWNSITIGDSSLTGGININQSVSFQDDVIFRQDQVNATTGIESLDNTIFITTTDGADASFYGDDSYNWSAINATIAGDLLFNGFRSLSLRLVDVDGNLTVQNTSNTISLHSNANVSVDGDISLTTIGSYTQGIASSAALSARGDITITASDIVLYSGSTITGNANGSSTLILKPYTTSSTIGLGGGSGTFNLDDTELSQISTFDKVIIGDSTSGTGAVDINSWDLSSKAFDVEIYGGAIDIGGLTLGSGDFMAHARNDQDLTVSAAITKAIDGVSTLDLRADKNITVNAAMTASDANSDGDSNAATDADSLNIVLNADSDADQDGAIVISGSTITTNGGWFVAGGGSGTLWGTDGIKGTADDGTSTGADKIAAYGNGSFTAGVLLNNGDISTGAGDIIINGHGYGNDGFGIYVESGSYISSTSGNIAMKGTGSNSSNSDGVRISDNGTYIESSSGDIVITGTGGSGGSNTDGILIYRGAIVQTTGGGDITLTGSVPGTNTSNIGVRIFGTDTSQIALVQTTGGGDITINATVTAGVGFSMQSYAKLVTSGAASDNYITINTDNIDIAANSNYGIYADPSYTTVRILPATSSRTIGIGGGSGTINLNDTELSRIYTAKKLVIGDNASGTGAVDIDSWDLSSKAYDVEVYGGAIDIGGLTLGSGDFMAYARNNQDLTVSAAITKAINGVSTLDLRADKNIIVNAGITASDANSDGDSNAATDADSLNIVLNSDRDADQDGAVYSNGALSSNGGNITIGGGDDPANEYAYGSADNTYDHGVYIGQQINAAGGDISIYGYGGNDGNINAGINIGSSIFTTGSGTITLDGRGGAGVSSNNGIRHVTGNARIQTENGEILIRARGGGDGSGTDNYGLYMNNQADIYSTGGAINIYAYGGLGTSNNHGLITSNSESYIQTVSGDIFIEGTSGGGSSSRGLSHTGTIQTTGTGLNAGDIEIRGDKLNLVWGYVYSNDGDIDIISSSSLVFNNGKAKSSGSGNVLVSAAGDINMASSPTTEIKSVDGDVTLIMNSVSGNSSFQLGSTNGDVTIKAYNPALSIDVGHQTSGSIKLSDAFLANIIAGGTLTIGDSVNGTGTIDIDSWDLSGTTYNVEVYGNTIDLGGMTLGAGDVLLKSIDDITLSSAVGNSNGGGDLYLAVGDDFINTAGSSAINAGAGGRYLIYVNSPSDVTGGLSAKNLYNRTYSTNLPSTITQTGDFFVYAYQPTLTFTADDVSLAFDNPSYSGFTYTLSGLVNGDTATDAFTGAPAYTQTANAANAYLIDIDQGTVTSDTGYQLVFVDGTLTYSSSGPSSPPTPPAPAAPSTSPAPELPASAESQITTPTTTVSQTTSSVNILAENKAVQTAQSTQNGSSRTQTASQVVTMDTVEIDQPVSDFFGLCSLDQRYCHR